MKYVDQQKEKYTFPVIIPPVVHKAGVLHNELKNMWHYAKDALTNTTDLIIFGYSCPPTDTESANLIRRSIGASSNIKNISIIDPNPSTIIRYFELTRFNKVYYYTNAEAFFKIGLQEAGFISEIAVTKELS
ncbi:MAG: hypothetical protein ACOYVD_11710 [Bacillota bacterium]